MARTCALTGKKPRSGNNRPFSLKATKRTFRPNLFTKRVLNPETGQFERMRLSAKAIRTLKKWEKEMIGELDIQNTKGVAHAEGEGKHIKKDKLTPKQKKELEASKEKAAKEAAKTEVQKEIEAADAK